MQNWVKIGRCAVELLGIFDFQNGGRPPSWIWYVVIADHPRLVFDGPNIVLKLHIDRANILRDITIFIAYFRGILGDMTVFPLELGTGARGQKTRVLGLPDGRRSSKIGLAV